VEKMKKAQFSRDYELPKIQGKGRP